MSAPKTAEAPNWTKKVMGVDSRVIWGILLLLLVISLIFPLGLPVNVTKWTREFYKYIEDIPEGSVVLVANSVEAGQTTQFPNIGAIFTQLMRRPIKFVIVHFHHESPFVTRTVLEEYVSKDLKAKKTYGLDYVILGFVPGLEIGVAGFLSDIRSVCKTDTFGTPIDDLPLMKGLHNSKDFYMAITVTIRFDFADIDVRQYAVSAKMLLLLVSSKEAVPGFQPYYPQLIKAYLEGPPAAAEYEALLGIKGLATLQNDLFGVCYGYVFILLIMGNVVYALDRYYASKKGK